MSTNQHLDHTGADLRGTDNSAEPDGYGKLKATRLQQRQKVNAHHGEDSRAQGEHHRQKCKC